MTPCNCDSMSFGQTNVIKNIWFNAPIALTYTYEIKELTNQYLFHHRKKLEKMNLNKFYLDKNMFFFFKFCLRYFDAKFLFF